MRRPGRKVGTDGGLDARHADGMAAHTEALFQMGDVHHQGQGFVTPVIETVEQPHAHVVDARQHGAVKGRGPPVQVALGARQVHAFVGGPVIGLLEKLEGSDMPFLETAEVLHRKRGEIDIDPADIAAALARLVNGVNGVQYIVDAAAGIGLSRHHQNPLVPLAQDDPGFLKYLVPAQGAAGHFGIGFPEGAVQAFVGAEIGDIQRSEQHDAVAVNFFLDRLGGVVQLRRQFRRGKAHQHGHVRKREPLQFPGLGKDLARPRRVLAATGGGKHAFYRSVVQPCGPGIRNIPRHGIPLLAAVAEPPISGFQDKRPDAQAVCFFVLHFKISCYDMRAAAITLTPPRKRRLAIPGKMLCGTCRQIPDRRQGPLYYCVIFFKKVTPLV